MRPGTCHHLRPTFGLTIGTVQYMVATLIAPDNAMLLSAKLRCLASVNWTGTPGRMYLFSQLIAGSKYWRLALGKRLKKTLFLYCRPSCSPHDAPEMKASEKGAMVRFASLFSHCHFGGWSFSTSAGVVYWACNADRLHNRNINM